MMLNDAAWEISDIDNIPHQDDYNDTRIIVSVPYHLARKLSVSYKENNFIIKNIVQDYIDKIELQHHTSSLLFDGREPRKDVLNKLLEIAKELQRDSHFPNFYRKHLEQIVKRELGNSDPRTYKKYLKCIKGFAEISSGKCVTAYMPYYLFHFREAVEEKLNGKE